MQSTKALGLIVLGAAVGLFSATLGSGGGSIVVPGLTVLFHHRIKSIIPVSLSMIVLTTLTGATTHYFLSPNSIQFTTAGLILIGSFLGAKLGSALTHKLRSWVLMYLSAFILIFAGLKLFGIINIPANIESASLSSVLLIVLGLCTGTLSAMLGIGAGVILVPMLNIFFGLPIHHAIPTALLVIAPTTLVGSLFHQNQSSRRSVKLGLLKYLIPGAIVGAILGAFINQWLSESTLKIILGIYVLISAIELFLTADTSLKKGHRFLEP